MLKEKTKASRVGFVELPCHVTTEPSLIGCC